MNSKMESYLNSLFAGVPRTRQAQDLRDELLGNMQERYEDYLREGKTESQAYSQTVASMGDIDELIAEVMPNDEFRREAQYYRTRNARNTAIGVALYIIGLAMVVGSRVIDEPTAATMSVVGLLVLAAIATALIIYTYMSTPVAYKDYDHEERREREFDRSADGNLFKGMLSIYWSVVTLMYLMISFIGRAWSTSWLIWPIAGIISGILRTIAQMRDYHD